MNLPDEFRLLDARDTDPACWRGLGQYGYVHYRRKLQSDYAKTFARPGKPRATALRAWMVERGP